MPSEEQELRLTVTLDDQASATLQQLQQTLSQLGGSSGNQSATAMSRFAAGLQGANQHAGNLHSSLGSLAARGGFIGGVFFEIGRQVSKMAEEFAKAVLDVKAYADAMVSLDNAASRAATSAAQFQRNIASMRESGISAADAAKNIQGLSDAIADMQQDQSKVRENLLAGLRGPELEDMRNHIRRLMTLGREEATAEAKRFQNDIRAYWTRQGQAERGALAARQYAEAIGMPDLDRMREEMTTVSPELEKLYNQRMDNARRYQTAVEKQGDAWERSIRSIQATAFQVLPLVEGMEGFAGLVEDITKMLELWENLIGNANEEKPPPGGGQEPDTGQPPSPFDERFGPWPGGGRTWRIPTPGGGAAPKPGSSWWDWFGLGTGENLPEEREGKLRDALERAGRERLGGGAQRFMGGVPDTGQGAATDRYTIIKGNTEQVVAATEQFKRLNDFFELLDMAGESPLSILSGGRLGGGGGTPGGGGSPDGTNQSSPTDGTQTTATGVTPPGHQGPLPPVPWPEPSAGNVIPPGFGTGAGTGPVGGAGAVAPWAGTVAPGAGGAYEGKPVAVPPGWGPGGSGQPWGTTPGGGAGGAAPGGGPGGDAGQAAFLKQHRANIMQELQDPAKRDRFMGLVQAEVGSDPAAQKAFAEATIDRWAARGQDVNRGIASRYYGGNPRYKTPTEATRSQMPGILEGVTQGSASFPGATGNASAGVAARHAAAGRRAGIVGGLRESIIYEENAQDRAFRANVERARSGQAAAPPAGATQTTQQASTQATVPGTNVDGQSATPRALAALQFAQQHLGENETKDRGRLSQFFAENKIRIDPKETAWCAAFINANLRKAGIQDTGSLAAASYFNWGTRVRPQDVQAGDVAVRGHHVAFTTGRTEMRNGELWVETIGGNQGGSSQQGGGVTRGWVRASSFSQYRRATDAQKLGPNVPGAPVTAAPGTYPAVPFTNIPGLGPKPITSDILTSQGSDTTALRPGATRTDPGVALDARTLDSSPSEKVNVKGDATVRVNVRTDPKYTTDKENLHKDTPIARQTQMEPAKKGPAESADVAMEE